MVIGTVLSIGGDSRIVSNDVCVGECISLLCIYVHGWCEWVGVWYVYLCVCATVC